MLLNNGSKIEKEIENYLQNENRNNTKNHWHTTKAGLKGKIIVLQNYLKKQKSQMNSIPKKT